MLPTIRIQGATPSSVPLVGTPGVGSTASPGPAQAFPPGAWILLLVALVIAVLTNAIVFARFRKKYSRLQAQHGTQPRLTTANRDGYPLGDLGLVIASRGPVHSLDAELQSASARWRHVSMAFPRLAMDDRESQKIIVVGVNYTNLDAVRKMQELVRQLVANRFKSAVTEPEWINELGPDFDALRHPQLAIASASIYTFPFLLTWQRRHQWGVLPYATHTRLGVVIHKDHSRYAEIRQLEADYNHALEEAKQTHSPYWVNDPRYVRWLPLVLDAAGTGGVSLNRSVGTIGSQHTSATVFSVGAYLHKELLPLACAIAGNSELSLRMITVVQQLEVSEFAQLLDPQAQWPKDSALIVDLAHLPSMMQLTHLELIRLAHCVYVPVGIGFSIVAYPLVITDIDWTYDLVRDAGESLIPARSGLSQIGIELDERLWARSQER